MYLSIKKEMVEFNTIILNRFLLLIRVVMSVMNPTSSWLS